MTISEMSSSATEGGIDLGRAGEGHGAAVYELAMQLHGVVDDDAIRRVLHAAGYQAAFVNQARGQCHAALRSAPDPSNVQAALALLDEAMGRALAATHAASDGTRTS